MKSIVVTTISAPTPQLTALSALAREQEACRLIVVADRKTPEVAYAGFDADFLSVAAQIASAATLPPLLRWNHYARKNAGYLSAIAAGSTCILETDDDNAPTTWDPAAIARNVSGTLLSGQRWINVYRWYTDAHIWPRGFPLQFVSSKDDSTVVERPAEADCPVQQWLPSGDPDVDAVYRLTVGRDDHAFDGASLILEAGSFVPFNSQSTAWFEDAFMYLYLPSFVTFRMTDIWRSFIAQVCLWAEDKRLAYHPAGVHQERNDHDLVRDFQDEIPGYLHNDDIVRELSALKLSSDPADRGANLRACYEHLHGLGLVEGAELELVDAWIHDVNVAVNTHAP